MKGYGKQKGDCKGTGKGKAGSKVEVIDGKGWIKGKGEETGGKVKGKGKGFQDKGTSKGKGLLYGGCYTCGGPHFSRDCPRGKRNTLARC